jgi:hypothetical protein
MYHCSCQPDIAITDCTVYQYLKTSSGKKSR